METLLNSYGVYAAWPLFLVAVPVAVLGLRLRRRALGARAGAEAATRRRRPIRDVRPGEVTLVGAWQPLEGGRGMLEEEPGSPHRVLVERDEDAPPIAGGTEVLVVGQVSRQLDDPRPAGYRETPRVWVVDARGEAQLVSTRLDALDRARARAGLRAAAAALLFAAAVAVAVAATLVMCRVAGALADGWGWGDVG